MAESEAMPQTFLEEYEDTQQQQYIEAKEAYQKDKLSKIKTIKHE